MARYAETTDLVRLGLPAAALTGVSSTIQEAALEAASEVARGYLREKFSLPLASWADDLRRCVCAIAAYDLMVTRGFSPAAGSDEHLRLRHEDAMRWLRDIATGHIIPAGMVDATPSESEGLTYAVMNTRRRWTR
jgi:phage gp36-like protein